MLTSRSQSTLVLLVLFLVVSCSYLVPRPTLTSSMASTPAAIAVDSASADPRAPTVAAAYREPPITAVPSSPVCESLKTPLPTPTPGAHLPSPAPTPTAAAFPALAGRSQLLETRVYGASIGQTMPVALYLPPGYFDSDRRYPVLYMLSGFAGDPLEWVDYGLCDALETLIRGGYIQPMIVVMPSGDHSWWFNHAAVPGSDGKAWGDYIWKDVVDYVDANYRTLPRPESRAVGGLSAGGQGALMLSLTHPERFRIAGAHSPSLRHADGSLAFFGDQQYFNPYDPLWLLQNTAAWKGLDLWIDVGDDDQEWGSSIHALHDLLTSLGVPHAFQDTWHGIHDGYYWGAHVGDYMMWYASQLAGQPSQ